MAGPSVQRRIASKTGHRGGAERSDLGARGGGGGAIVGFRGSRKCPPGQTLNLGGRCRFGGHFGVDSGVALGSSFGTIFARSWDALRKILGRSSDDLGTIFARSWDGLRKILRRSSQDVKAERGAVTCDSSTRSGCHRPTPSCHMSPLHAQLSHVTAPRLAVTGHRSTLSCHMSPPHT